MSDHIDHIDLSGEPLVRAVNVHKSFGSNEVLKGVDLDVYPGEAVVLLGPSGSGKTTFLRLINQMETLTGGRIWVDGELIGYEERDGRLYQRKDSDIARQRSHIGMVFQRFNLFQNFLRFPQYGVILFIRVFHRQIKSLFIHVLYLKAPGIVRAGLCLLQLYKLCKILLIQWICFSQVPSGIKLVIPYLFGRFALFEKEYNCFDPGSLEYTARKVKHGMQITAFKQ